MTSGPKISVRLAAERVFLKAVAGERTTTFELSAEEARRLRAHLDDAIAAIEAGWSVLPTFAGFLTTLPVRNPAS